MELISAFVGFGANGEEGAFQERRTNRVALGVGSWEGEAHAEPAPGVGLALPEDAGNRSPG